LHTRHSPKPVNRLTRETYEGDVAGHEMHTNPFAIEYEYDPGGNRLSRMRSGYSAGVVGTLEEPTEYIYSKASEFFGAAAADFDASDRLYAVAGERGG